MQAMQTGASFSSLQTFQQSSVSYATTQLSSNLQAANEVAREEITNGEANSVPQSTIDENGKRETSSVLSSTSLLNDRLSDFQKNILNKAMEKVAEVKEEMLEVWENLFSHSNKSSRGVQNGSFSIESFLDVVDAQLQQKELGAGIVLSQGFSQTLRLSMHGSIVANDGTVRQLDVNIEISQSFMQNLQFNSSTQGSTQSNTQSSSNSKVVDPLVIDYEGSGTELSDTKMHFDLDSDGTPDQISTLKEGSGFLALDKNGDGKINDGNELFGTQSGDGFKDLSQYDANKDGKIDREDPIYDKLRIWVPDANGEGQLVGLGEKGIGVIYLNAEESKELMKGSNGALLGIKQKTADFLYDNGKSGEIHHIDLVSEKIKEESLQNQAQNDAILSGHQSVAQILAGKAYRGFEANFSSQFSSQMSGTLNGIFSPNGILGGILENSNLNFAQFSSLEVNISMSFSSLKSANNGVSLEVSQMWVKLESSFNAIETTDSNDKNHRDLGDSLLMQQYQDLNRFLFGQFHSRQSAFKESFLSDSIQKLLSA